MSAPLRILMAAAENDGLPGGKVGGIGDVIRDVAPALAAIGCQVAVATPSYGFLHDVPGAQVAARVAFDFGGRTTTATVYTVPGRRAHAGVTHFVIDHPGFVAKANGVFRIYCDNPAEGPYATDATKFALFCSAVAAAIGRGAFGPLDCMHLHDWHAAFLAILRAHHPRCRFLRELRTVYTIHNLALQGVRPLAGSASSLAAWYPELESAAGVADPRWPDCVNPMAAGIRFADAVHTVSPSYAREIVQPSNPPHFRGGEGLEADLAQAQRSGRLHGILNGCDYPEDRPRKLAARELLGLLHAQAQDWMRRDASGSSSHSIAQQRLQALAEVPAAPASVLTSVSRIVEQKMLLMRAPGADGRPGLHAVLEALGDDGVYVVLGSGDSAYERFLADTSRQFGNFVFLNGYSDACAEAMYGSGDLFLMPSVFEPCGIGQMLAMRNGQPCVVHLIGGLRDTVRDGTDGFGFGGDSIAQQVDGMTEACCRALRIKRGDPATWQSICERAANVRFSWARTVAEYVEKLYAPQMGSHRPQAS